MSARKQTSSRISSAAARLRAKLPKRGKITIAEGVPFGNGRFYWFALPDLALPVSTLRSLLASLISQDEVKGQSKPKRKRRRSAR